MDEKIDISGHVIRVDKKELQELESFLKSKGVEVSKNLAFKIAVRNFIREFKDRPIIISE